LTSHGWGFLSDTYGRRKILIISSLCAFTTSLFSSLSMNFIQMVIFRFLNGFFISGVSGTIYAYLGEFLDAKSRSRSMMVSSFIYGVACIALPLIAMVIINEEWSFEIPILNIDFKPWRLFILICSLQSLLSGILLWNCPESPRYTYSCKKDEQWTMKIFDRIQIINFGRIKHDFKLTPIVTSEMEGTCDKSVVKMMKDQLIELTFKYPRSFMIMSVLQFGTYFVCNGLLIFFPDILNQTASLSGSNIQMCDIVEAAIANKTAIQTSTDVKICVEKFDISVYYFVIYLESCYVIGFFLISILLWMKLKRLIILNFIFFTTGVCGILITYIPNVTVSSYLFVWLLTAGLNVNLLNTITYELFPTHLRALAMGLSMMIGRLGEYEKSRIYN
jgi:MFS transporter, VNT family, synaptic vesicle glycoprotein 2